MQGRRGGGKTEWTSGEAGQHLIREIAGNKVLSEEAYIILGGEDRAGSGNRLSRRVSDSTSGVLLAGRTQPGRLPFSSLTNLRNGSHRPTVCCYSCYNQTSPHRKISHHDVALSLLLTSPATFSDLVSNFVTTAQRRNPPQERCYPNVHVADTLARISDKRPIALGDALVGLLTSHNAIADTGIIARRASRCLTSLLHSAILAMCKQIYPP